MLVLAQVMERLSALEEALAERDRQLSERDARILALEKQVTELEERIRANSSNSGQPPSSDTPAERDARRQRAISRREPSGKKRGGQPGHKGHRRQMYEPDQVSAVVVCAPAACGECGEDLTSEHDVRVDRHQVVELPPIRPHVTEYEMHDRHCAACGVITHAKRPDGAPPGGFGPRLTALAGVLTGSYHLSRSRAVALLRDTFGVRMSTGALSTCEHRVSEALAPSYEEAKRHVQQADNRYIDATTWFTNASRSAVWVVATVAVTLIAMTANASRAALLGLVGRITGRVVSDRAKVFDCWSGNERQTCWAHLLRYFEAMAQRDGPSSDIGATLCNYTLAMFSVWHDFKRGALSRAELQAMFRKPPRGSPDPTPFVDRFRDQLHQGLDCGHRATAGTCRDILDNHWAALWTFIDIDGIDPTNNHAERELRSTVMWRQRSFGAQSERGNRFAERITTTDRTLRKRGASLYPFLCDAIAASWTGQTPPALMPQDLVTP